VGGRREKLIWTESVLLGQRIYFTSRVTERSHVKDMGTEKGEELDSLIKKPQLPNIVTRV
jgi:hypothetical protein